MAKRRNAAERHLQEAIDLLDNYVDPREALEFEGGELGVMLGRPVVNPSDRTQASQQLATTEPELWRMIEVGRDLYNRNPFAKNAVNSRVNYIVGYGHQYGVTACEEETVAEAVLAAVQKVLDDFCRVNHWHHRQRESVLRQDRDGECFLRFFDGADGMLRVRFVEPEHVVTPPGMAGRSNVRFGVETQADDVETVVSYHVKLPDSEPECVPACDMQHRKRNVDMTVARGISTLYLIAPYLRGADGTLGNMRATVNIQTAIAMIRKHLQGAAASVRGLLDANADTTRTNPLTGKTRNVKQYRRGTIIDAPATIEYQFPASMVQVDKIVAALQADLRAAASGTSMPEYMLSSDASNANYASTLVSESPTVKNFECLQQSEIEFDREVLLRAIRCAVRAGVLPEGIEQRITIDATAPTLIVRDPLQEEQCRQIRRADRVESIETSQLAAGLDPVVEAARLAAQAELAPDTPSLPSLDSLLGPSEPAAAPSDAEVPADTALNGAQISSLVNIIQLAAAGAIPERAVTPLIKASFPLLTDATIAALVSSLKGFEPSTGAA